MNGTTGGQWTRDDFARLAIHPMSTPTTVLDEVAAWLNTHHPKPLLYARGGFLKPGPQVTANAAETDAALRAELRGMYGERDRLKLLLEDAEHARDSAVARAEQAESERGGWRENAEHRSTIIEQLRARARQAEELAAQRAETVRRLRDAHSNLIARHRRLTDQSDKPSSAVSRAEIGNALMRVGRSNGVETHAEVSAAADAVWALVSDDDPPVFVVRESHLPEVWNNDDDAWESPRRLVRADEVPRLRGLLDNALGDVAFYGAVARAIEAGQAVDPVEAEVAMVWAEYRKDYQPNDVITAHKAFTSGYQAARHVLGQEGDQ